jgi:threonine dehydratase
MASTAEHEFVELDSMERARAALRSKIVETPLLQRRADQDTFVGDTLRLSKLSLKLENMQVQGSFKIRGILNVLGDPTKRRGKLVTMSAGNFGRSWSYATSQCKDVDEAVVLMPLDVPRDRVQACRSFGAKVQLVARTKLQARVDAMVRDEGFQYAHPFDDMALIEGYGSIGFEIGEQIDGGALPDVIVCGVGGGGLISGVAAAVKLRCERDGVESMPRIVGVEPEGACAMAQSLRRGSAVHLTEVNSFVNGLSAPFAGTNCLRHVQRFVDEIVLVDDDAVRAAMRTLFERYKIVAESAGAAAFAALQSNRVADVRNKSVVVIVSGGNVDLDEFVEQVLIVKND